MKNDWKTVGIIWGCSALAVIASIFITKESIGLWALLIPASMGVTLNYKKGDDE